MIASVLGIILNPICLPYFTRGKTKISNTLYTLIIAIDILICISTIPSSVSVIYNRQPMWLGNNGLCSVTGFVMNISSRMSVFLIATLSVFRTVSICFPFWKHNYFSTLFTVFIYFLFNVLLATTPLVFSDTGYTFYNVSSHCSWAIESLSFVEGGSKLYHVLIYAFIILPWLVPGMIVTVSCVISIHYITAGSRDRRNMSPTMERNNRVLYATTTIIIVTIVYIIFNMPCWIFYIAILTSTKNPVQWLQGNVGLYFDFFVSQLSIVLNSCINPIVYMCRMQALRRAISVKIENTVILYTRNT